jgi:hypothetical protein
MKKALFLFLFFSPVYFYSQYKSGEDLLKAMHKKYAGKYCPTVQFDQSTIRYEKDVVKDTIRWYEWISYPDKFRIDFGKRFGGNCVIFKNDSAFHYKNHKLVGKERNENDLLLLLGGMYFREFEDVRTRLKRAGYDIEKVDTGYAHAKRYACVIGNKDKNSNKIYIDPKYLRVTGLQTKLSETDKLEIYFYDFMDACRGFMETKVSAYKNGVLEQKEEYSNIKTNIAIPDSIFNKK